MTLYEGDMSDTRDEYATAPDLWRPISDALNGFDLDPAAGCEPESIAREAYTVDDDDLSQPWHGNVWLNPPFSNKLPWYRKAVNELEAGNVDTVIALAPVDTSTQWFQNWYSKAELICWLEGRDWYVADGSPSFNTTVGVFGDYPTELHETLARKGVCTVVADDPRGEQQTL
jgi:hypothetical protein